MKRILFLFLGIIFFGVTSAQEKYGVIVGSTININTAFMLRSNYLEIGFDDTEVLIQKGGPNYRVCIGVFSTRAQAVKVRDMNIKNYKIPYDAWLLKIYDYKKTEKKKLAGKLEGKTVSVLDSAKMDSIIKIQKKLEEKIYVLDSNVQEIKTLNVGMEKKLNELKDKQNNSSSSFEPIYKPLTKNSSGAIDISDNMSVYGLLAIGLTGVDPATVGFGFVGGTEFNFEENMHVLVELQFLDGGGGRKYSALAGFKYDFYTRANLILSGLAKVGYCNVNPDGPGGNQSAFEFQIGFAPEFRLSNEISIYSQFVYSGTYYNSNLDNDVIGLVGVKYYF